MPVAGFSITKWCSLIGSIKKIKKKKEGIEEDWGLD